MIIDKNLAYARVIVTPETRVPNAVYQVYFVHDTDTEMVHFQFTEADNLSTNMARYAEFMVDTSKFKMAGNYKLYIYAKQSV